MVANFANILIGILAPTARRLMCDISPCGGGRAFFALAADGGLYPCSEFIGSAALQRRQSAQPAGSRRRWIQKLSATVTTRDVDLSARAATARSAISAARPARPKPSK
jgi:uncharacterized protein